MRCTDKVAIWTSAGHEHFLASAALTPLVRSLAANFLGKGWRLIVLVASLPVYTRLLGIEAFGLVAFFLTLQASTSVLDFGLSITLNRELARRANDKTRAKESRDLVRTLEVAYWLLAVIIAGAIILAAPWISVRWLKAEHLSPSTVRQAVALMGLAVAAQFPFALYSGGLLGLGCQVAANALDAGMTTLRVVGSVLALWLISPTIQMFMIWQAVTFLFQSLLAGWWLWRNLPFAGAPARLRAELVRHILPFTLGVAGIAISGTVLTQMDEVVLSKFVSLEVFGYYNVAATFASGLLAIILPVSTAVFPRLTHLVATKNVEAVAQLYKQSSQLLAVLLVPATVTLCLFSSVVLSAWTGSPIIARNTHVLATVLVIGTGLNGLMHMPYALQLAYGWTKLGIWQNVATVIVALPFTIWATSTFGATGAAAVWPLLNTAYLIIGVQVMHTRLLPSEKVRWYKYVVGLPVLGAVLVAVPARWYFWQHNMVTLQLPYVLLVLIFATITVIWLTPTTNDLIRHVWKSCKVTYLYRRRRSHW